MAHYGEIIDDFDPQKDHIYTLFTNYFKNPKMIKIKDTQTHSMYLCKLYCLLNRECRFIIAFVEKNNSHIDTVEHLDLLKWVSLQTRTLPENEYPNIDVVHGYQAVSEGQLTSIINRTKIDDVASTYECQDIPIIITLLHTEKNTKESYQNKGSVINALETFNTIITFIK